MSTSIRNQAMIDHRVYRTWLEVLFRDALAGNETWKQRIQVKPDQDIVERFAKFVERIVPVVAIESSLPYAEHLLIELIREHAGFKTPAFLPALTSGYWQAGQSKPMDARTPLVLSFQESAHIENSLQLVHAIEVSDNPVLIGCDRLGQVPLEFQRLIDLTLTLPVAGAQHFERVFEALFGEPLPADASEDVRWRNFVLPTDVQPPLRLGRSAADAARYIRGRVQERLSRLEVSDAPALDELHGLGAARQIALDLVKDIRHALDGRIDWDEVDRGMLLAGPPGTGKTTLAMSIARECGVKFIAASASTWQAVNGLGEHLAQIRTTFEEARRFAPSILFIDELDSIGNRETLDGHGQTYQATVINYLLEQLDGFSDRGDIVVIGATNYPEAIDPALRRAGRLDQLVEVGYPTIRALAKIYAYHLRRYRAAGSLAADIDCEALAQISFGLTGADVEFFVRGAARRARKRSDSIHQDDLVAEIMRRPRSENRDEPFDAETIHRLAVHEAGHVVMRLLGKNHGSEISYVTIAPRSDGRIGYTATFDERVSMTREDYLHEIRILLAGRAAERVMFGADGVSDMAGKYADESDLARSMQYLQHMTLKSGLGREGRLTWLTPDSLIDRDSEIGALEHTLAGIAAETHEAISNNRVLLETVAGELVKRQELDRDDLARIGAAAPG